MVNSPALFNIYSNDQPIHKDTHSFIYADVLYITTQDHSIEKIEASALDNIGAYYNRKHVCDNIDKTQTCAFHLRNREDTRDLRSEIGYHPLSYLQGSYRR